MRVVAISDTHMYHERITLPEGDLLVHAGDSTRRGELDDLEAFLTWLRDQPHRHKVLIAGNHDFCFETEKKRKKARALVEKMGNIIYLQDREVTVEGYKVWGSPWQPWFYNWAFNLSRGPSLAKKWALIPADTDILVTHGPPKGILDRTDRGEQVGCEELRARVEVIQPKLHIFGHIHEGYGQEGDGHTIFVNAASCDERYRPINSPIVVDLP